MLKDLQFAWRTLRGRPLFAVVAVLSLALGIGASTAIFSVIEGTLLRSLPYPHSERLMLVGTHQPCCKFAGLSAGEYFDYKYQSKTIQDLAAFLYRNLTLTGWSDAQEIAGMVVTPNYFDVLGAKAELGRLMSPKIDKPSAGTRVAVISDDAWRSFFGSDPKILGRDVTLDGHSFRIIGVLSTKQSMDTQVWISPQGDFPEDVEAEQSSKDVASLYGSHWMRCIGRLRPGITPEQAEAELRTIGTRIGVQHPRLSEHYGVVKPLHDWIVPDLGTTLWVLFAAVVILLLIACANLAGLLLARATGRTRELAVRVALGATRERITTLFLSESLVLAILGGAFGIVFAEIGLRLIDPYIPYSMPSALAPELNVRVLIFCLGMTSLTVIGTGLLPALTSAQLDVNDGLKEGSKGSAGGQTHRLRSLLVGGEIAVSVMLLIGASLLVHSFSILLSIDPGFNAERVTIARLSLPQARYHQPIQVVNFWHEVLLRLSAIPGLEKAGLLWNVPFANEGSRDYLDIEGRPVGTKQLPPYVNMHVISPETLNALRVPLLEGRRLNDRDSLNSLQVALVDKQFADKVFPHESAIGKRFRGGPNRNWTTIVGVVGNVKYEKLNLAPGLNLYMSYAQFPVNSLALILKTKPGISLSLDQLRGAVHSLGPNIPITGVKPLADNLSHSLVERRFLLGLMTAFSSFAVLLASIGLYATFAYSVQQRKQEIGIRITLGATRSGIAWLILRECLTIAAFGTAAGILGATWATSFLKSMLYGITASDLTSYAAAVILILVVAIAASLAPALRATRIDPLSALRYE